MGERLDIFGEANASIKLNLDKDEMTPGLFLAVMSLKAGEKAWFKIRADFHDSNCIEKKNSESNLKINA